MDNNQWSYYDKVFDGDIKELYGFVYIITNNNTKKSYIGKKAFWFNKRINKKKVIVESDWKNYYGSHKGLIAEIKEVGKENYTRTIIRLCKEKAEATWFELEEQIKCDVLKSDLYYNDNILGKFYKTKIGKYYG